jgi:hypothetical protein
MAMLGESNNWKHLLTVLLVGTLGLSVRTGAQGNVDDARAKDALTLSRKAVAPKLSLPDGVSVRLRGDITYSFAPDLRGPVEIILGGPDSFELKMDRPVQGLYHLIVTADGARLAFRQRPQMRDMSPSSPWYKSRFSCDRLNDAESD